MSYPSLPPPFPSLLPSSRPFSHSISSFSLFYSLSLSLSEGQRYSHISRSSWQRCSKKEREAARGRGGGEVGVVGWWGGEAGDVWTMLMLLHWSSIVCFFFLLSAPTPLNSNLWYNSPHLFPPTFISLFSFVLLSFHSHYSHTPAGILLPVVLKLNLHIVLSLLS